ncbi:MAG: carbohydrate ABC transporter permease [Clostridia bacterium]|nr:carbohydrate ABC transporter permease [Clostridia bacterium]
MNGTFLSGSTSVVNHYFSSRKRRESMTKIFATLILSLGAITYMIPLFWMLSTALKSDAELFVNKSFIPRDWAFDNFRKAWTSAPFTQYFINTCFVTFTGVFGTLLSNSIVAYGFAKINFKGKNVIFLAVLATMMIPGTVTMIPSYILFSKLRWVGTFLPLIVPTFTASAYYLFLTRQFMLGIPMAYSEAARIEGANEFQIFSRIVLPQCKPIMTAIAVFEFNAKWNDFMGALLYLNDEKMYTLQIGLQTFKGTAGMEWQKFMAASIIVLLPVIILFFFMQKYIIQGVSIGGIKG